ncbi:MAG: acylneuraminate cytidylyltransferase [Gemmatimonadetes bacterium]|nr:acylneuraminate cytidylyltransferase [Gemmatimonadota bacterium]
MSRVALICARGGSKGFPGKNLKILDGDPLIVRAIKQIKQIDRIDRILVSTDSRGIAEVAISAGAEVPFMRPSELAEDDSPEWEVWRHAVTYLKEVEGDCPDLLMVVPPTAPLRSKDDLESILDEYERGQADIVITVTDAHRSPYFNQVKIGDLGLASLAIHPKTSITRRQDTPEIFDVTTVAYVARPEFIMEKEGIFEGDVRTVFVPKERALDIDTDLDFRLAEFFLSH